jgi:16S rRNA (uracil1498-N3)-methyltransferase
MARRRFFVDAVRNGRAELSGEAAEHLRRVLRVQAGQQFELSDNQSLYLAEVEEFRKGAVSFRILDRLEAENPPLRLTLFASLIKFDRFEWIVEKATELGVERIVPVVAERSEKGLGEAAIKRIERWRRIALESSQQSRRARVPEVGGSIRFTEAMAVQGVCRLFLEEERGAAPILSALPEPARRSSSDDVSLLVGPEGGWTEEERLAAAAGGWQPVSLGPLILRAETAAISAIAILVSAWSAREIQSDPWSHSHEGSSSAPPAR